MAKWTGKSKGTPLGYKIFITLVKIDTRVAYLLLIPVSLYYLLFSNKTQIKYFYKQRLNYGKAKTIISVYKNYLNLGKVLIDKIAILSGQKDSYNFNFEGEQHLHKIVEEKKGGLLLGAHMGNWEVAGELLERVDTVVNILMVDNEHNQLKEIIEKATNKKNVNIIQIKDDISHVILVIEAFKRKELVVMHGDRFVDGTQTVTIDFLGEMAKFPIGPMVLASKFGIPVSFVFSLKESNRNYHFYATEGKIYSNKQQINEKQQAIENMVKEYSQNLERMVKKYPLQWFNYHKFWINQ